MALSTVTEPSQASATSELAPANLRATLTNLTQTTFVGQGNSMVLQRQVVLNAITENQDLVDKIRRIKALQTTLKDNSAYYLDQILPRVIHGVTDASAVYNLYQSLKQQVDESSSKPIDQQVMASMLNAILDRIEEKLQSAKDLRELATDQATVLKKQNTDFQTLIAELDKLLGGSETSLIAQTQKEIATVKQNIDQNINDIVKNAKEIGAGVKDLVTNILTTITSSKGGDKTDDKKSDDKSGDDSGGKKGDDVELDPFPVEAVGAVSEGASGVDDAVAALHRNNKKLEQLYQSLAQLNALLSVSRAVGDQVSNYETSISRITDTADSVVSSWQTVEANYRQVIATLGKDGDVGAVTALVNEAANPWKYLHQRLLELEDVLNGSGNLFPPQVKLTQTIQGKVS